MIAAAVQGEIAEINGKPELQLVLRFSNRNADDGKGGTIWPHRELIRTVGHCWWGWWKAANAFDEEIDESEILESLGAGKVAIGLWNRSLGRCYVAICEEVQTRGGEDFLSPEPAATPAYYRGDAYPAWFKLTEIHRVDGLPIDQDSELDEASGQDQPHDLGEVFRDLAEVASDRTILWINDKLTAPATIHRSDRTSVLHLSDLHFGRFHGWHSDQTPREGHVGVADALERAFASHQIDPRQIGVIVVSGDIISGEKEQSKQKESFDEAKRFLDRLFKLTGTSSKNLVIVPGNHDVMREVIDLKVEAPFDHTASEESTAALDRRKQGERQYRAFIDSIFGQPTEITRLRRFRLRGNYQLNFLEMNSTLPRDQFGKEFGFIGRTPLRYFWDMARYRANAARHKLKVINFAVLHHHVISTVDDEYVAKPSKKAPKGYVDPVSITLDASNLIDWCSEYGVRFLLHGHQHKSKWRFAGDRVQGREPFVTEVVGVGSLGAQWTADRELNSFNIYDLGEDGTLRARSIPLDPNTKPLTHIRDITLSIDGGVV
jgi:3',5'-cyclic AMP phosphodiesterase CpdA